MPHIRKRRIRRQKANSSIKFLQKRLKIIFSHKNDRRRVFIALGLILIGLVFLIFPTFYKNLVNLPKFNPQKASILSRLIKNDTANTAEPIHIDPMLLTGQEALQPPLRIVIPILSIDLPVVEANAINGYWELSETSASHGVGSANPGAIGNTVVFAHAREGLFLPLKNIKKDNLIYILTKDRWYRYKVTDIKFVDPNQIEVIAPTSDETLTLFTCSGFLDNKRLIVTAKPSRP